jgi:hypothetical protein
MTNSENESLKPATNVEPNFQVNVSNMTRYMRFLGILSIIGGALYCIGIITAIIGVPFIFMGIRMRESADDFSRYSSTGEKSDLYRAIEKQTRFFLIQYVFAIIGLVLTAIYLVVMLIIITSEL